MSKIVFSNVTKIYGNSSSKKAKSNVKSVDNLNLEINEKEFIAFVGPSGCGKSTTLRMIAGLEQITDGTISIDGDVINDKEPKDRGVTMVFQNYALYPHMTVYKNMSYGLKIKKLPKDEIDKRVKDAAEILNLTEYLDRKPAKLSGGQRQRVALGRAMVRDVDIFLMDEPLSNLDAKLRVSTRNQIRKLHNRLGTTTIYVTHDQVEAMTMADRIVIMNKGVVQQIGTPIDIYHNPVNKFVASFIGTPEMNFVKATIENNKVIINDENTLILEDECVKQLNNHNGEIILGFRPEHVLYNKDLDKNATNVITATVDHFENMGNEYYVYAQFNQQEICLRISESDNFDENATEIQFRLKSNQLHCFDVETEENMRKAQ